MLTNKVVETALVNSLCRRWLQRFGELLGIAPCVPIP